MFSFVRKNKTKKLEQNIAEGTFSFGKYSWKQFKKNRPSYIAYLFLLSLVVIALLAPVLANDKPVYCKYKGQTFFPALSFNDKYIITEDNQTETIFLNDFDWKHTKFESVVWPYCAFVPGKSDALNTSVSPGADQAFENEKGELIVSPKKFRHRLGTSQDGSDVFAGLVHGIKYSLLIGIFSMLLASLIGISLGALAGYFGDDRFKIKRGVAFILIPGLFIAWYYSFFIRHYKLIDAFEIGGFNLIFELIFDLIIFTSIIYLFSKLGKLISRSTFLKYEMTVPLDSIISRTIEVINSLPIFLVILSIAAISKPSFSTLIIIIGLISWTGIARLTRAELMKVSRLEYIQAAHGLGLSNKRIIFKHALPNAIGPALVAISFGIAGAILTESGLSFLGVGVPPEIVTWGKLLSEARNSSESWWLILFPGLAIFLTVTMYNLIGEGLRDALDPRLKR